MSTAHEAVEVVAFLRDTGALQTIGEQIGEALARKLAEDNQAARRERIAVQLFAADGFDTIEIALRATDKLIAALDGTAPALDVLAEYVADSEVSTESLDRLASAFHNDTGYMAPGKDEAAAVNSSHTHEERRAAWDAWVIKRKRERLERARAVLRAAGRLP